MDCRSFALLTSREREILTLVATGASNRQIADRLSISRHTVRAHLSSIYSKLGARNRTRAAILFVMHAPAVDPPL